MSYPRIIFGGDRDALDSIRLTSDANYRSILTFFNESIYKASDTDVSYRAINS